MDAELMAGALAASEVQAGGSATLVHLTRGERGHPTLDAAAFGAQLEGEMARASVMLGVPYRWLDLAAPLASPGEVVPALRALVGELRPELVVTHWIGSWHESHRRACRSVRAAVADLRGEGVAVDLMYAENCEDLNGFLPTAFAEVAPVVPRWLDAARSYELFRRSELGVEDQVPIPYHAYYTAALTVRALQAGLRRAVALMPEGERISGSTRDRFIWVEPPAP
jgi:LmbE family N-acetylglucosaminyl deacetylase